MGMDKKENKINKETDQENSSSELDAEKNHPSDELSDEKKVKQLEDKITRTLAEMENQRRRYEKEKDDAFEYGGFSFAKESLNLIDNLERSKTTIEKDESIKN